MVPISSRSRFHPRAIVRLEGLNERKPQLTLSEIESATFRHAAQCLNQLHHSQTLYNRNADR